MSPFQEHHRAFPIPDIELIGDAWAQQEKHEPSLADTLMAQLPSWLGGKAGAAAHKHPSQQQADYGTVHCSEAYGGDGAVVIWREGGVSVLVASVTQGLVYVP